MSFLLKDLTRSLIADGLRKPTNTRRRAIGILYVPSTNIGGTLPELMERATPREWRKPALRD